VRVGHAWGRWFGIRDVDVVIGWMSLASPDGPPVDGREGRKEVEFTCPEGARHCLVYGG